MLPCRREEAVGDPRKTLECCLALCARYHAPESTAPSSQSRKPSTILKSSFASRLPIITARHPRCCPSGAARPRFATKNARCPLRAALRSGVCHRCLSAEASIESTRALFPPRCPFVLVFAAGYRKRPVHASSLVFAFQIERNEHSLAVQHTQSQRAAWRLIHKSWRG